MDKIMFKNLLFILPSENRELISSIIQKILFKSGIRHYHAYRPEHELGSMMWKHDRIRYPSDEFIYVGPDEGMIVTYLEGGTFYTNVGEIDFSKGERVNPVEWIADNWVEDLSFDKYELGLAKTESMIISAKISGRQSRSGILA